MVEAWFASGRLVDIALGVIVVEAVVLIAWARWRPLDVALRLLPGALLMLALRAALTGAGWQWAALFLALSLPAHVADLMIGGRRPERMRRAA